MGRPIFQGEQFTPRCEQKWVVKVPIFQRYPEKVAHISGGTLKKCSSNTPIFQGEHFTPRCEEKVCCQLAHISGVP